MKFRRKMIMAYALVAVICALITGIAVFWVSYGAAVDVEKRNLTETADQIVEQMDTRLASMDASMDYMLSNMDILSAMRLLGREDGSENDSLDVSARATLRKNINTDFILKNCYRLVWFNRDGEVISSTNTNLPGTISSFDPDAIAYLETAEEAHGHSVLIGSRADPWVANDKAPRVFSMIKAIQGANMGYLEVENLSADLSDLLSSNKRIQYAIYINNAECIGLGNGMRKTVAYLPYLKKTDGVIGRKDSAWFTVSHSQKYNITVLTLENNEGFISNFRNIIAISILIGMVVFASGMLLVLFWSDILTKPLRQMRHVIDQTNLETLNQNTVEEVRIWKENDELQQLSDSYQVMTKRLHDAIQKEKKASLLQLQALYDSLQAQVNPHFIYNVLNVISARGVMDNDDTICEMCGALASILRYSTGNQRRYTRVDEEIEYLQNYYFLLRARFGEGLRFNFHISSEIRKAEIPKAVLQQIVENSIVHGFRDRTSDMEIDIIGGLEGNRCVLQIIDNGVGIEEDMLEHIKARMHEVREKILEEHDNIQLSIGGLGLINAYARCLLLYEDELTFVISNRSGRTGVETQISFPLIKDSGDS